LFTVKIGFYIRNWYKKSEKDVGYYRKRAGIFKDLHMYLASHTLDTLTRQKIRSFLAPAQ